MMSIELLPPSLPSGSPRVPEQAVRRRPGPRQRAQRRFRVSVLMLALGAVGAVGAVGAEDPLVAKVGNHAIPLSYVYRQIESLPLGDQLRYRENLPGFVESVIREELLFQYALTALLQRPSPLRERIKPLVVEQIIESQVRAAASVSEEEVARYYRENRETLRGAHRQVAHIPLPTRAQCDQLVPALTTYAKFTDAARRHGTIAALAARGGDMGYVMRHHNILGLGPALFEIPVKTPFVFENQDGCHILWINEHVEPPMPSLDEVRPRLVEFLRGRREADRLRELVDAAQAAIPVERTRLIEKE